MIKQFKEDILKIWKNIKVINDIRQSMMNYMEDVKEDKQQKDFVLTEYLIKKLKKWWIIPIFLISLVFKWDVFGAFTLLTWYFEVFIRYILNLNKLQRQFLNEHGYLLYNKRFTIKEYFYVTPIGLLSDEKKTVEKVRKIREENQIGYYVKQQELPDTTTFILKTINDNKKKWHFNLWDLNKKWIKGNKSYLKVRCIMQDGTSLNDIKKIKDKIESSLRKKIILTEITDKNSFILTVLLNEELASLEMDSKYLKKYNDKNEIFIGKSLTGATSNKWNSQANHIGIFGKSGSGKSEQIKNLLYQLINLKEYDYSEIYLTSSSKIGDFVEFEKAGGLVVSGVNNQLKVFKHVLTMLEDREKLFYEQGVASIDEYNKKNQNNKLHRILLLADEYENSLNDVDKKISVELERLMVSILNIGRSSGCLVIIAGQNSLKSQIGVALDKLTIKYIGNNNSNVLNQVDTEIANYFKILTKKPQGVFFFNAENLDSSGEQILFGNSNYALIQTPYIKNIKVGNMPLLSGKEMLKDILVDDSNKVLDEDLY